MVRSLPYPRHETLWRFVLETMHPTDLGHDAEHVYRVYQWVLALAPEAGVDADLAGAAALVHDLVQVPKSAPERAEAAARSADAACAVLINIGYGPDEVQAVWEAVRTASWSAGNAPTGPLGRLLQDADRLDAIGAIGVARTFACAQAMRGPGAAFYDADDPTFVAQRVLDDKRFALDHFKIKLLRLAESMHLPSARAEAQRRHAFMLTFLAAFEQDCGPALATAPSAQPRDNAPARAPGQDAKERS